MTFGEVTKPGTNPPSSHLYVEAKRSVFMDMEGRVVVHRG